MSSPRTAPLSGLAATQGGKWGEAYRIAVVTDDELALPVIEETLAPVFHTTVLPTAREIPSLLKTAGIEALLFDLEYGDLTTEEGLAGVERLHQLAGDLYIIALTREETPGIHQRAIAAGASECFCAPIDFEHIRTVLADALDRRAAVRQTVAEAQPASRFAFCDLVGGSPPMQVLYETIKRVADSNSTVLIRGESGAGKELVARAIQSLSSRSEKPFVSINCAALPENLIEAELFGHEKGSYTGAHESRAGHIENAHGGTLFLDEIATLGLHLQSKLLRVLEDRAVQRIGGKSRKIDFRLITATNEDLEAMVEAGRFREDLYYRINVVPISVPPLREREGDVALLAEHYLKIYCADNKQPMKRFHPEAMEVLENYEWPGNVRQLENLMQRLVLLAPGAVIEMKHLPQQILSHTAARQQTLLIPDGGIRFDEEMLRIERAYVEAALQRADGRRAVAANLLNVPPHKMKYLCRKHGL